MATWSNTNRSSTTWATYGDPGYRTWTYEQVGFLYEQQAATYEDPSLATTWTPASRNSTAWNAQSPNSTSWTDQAINSTSWTPQSRN